MKVTSHTEKRFEITLTDFESGNLKKLATKSSCDSAKLLEHLLDSSLSHAVDAFDNLHDDVMGDQLDSDGNVIGGDLPPWDV